MSQRVDLGDNETLEPGHSRFYFDTTFVDDIPESSSPNTSGLLKFIGNDADGCYPCGRIADVRIFDRVLSKSEIYDLYEQAAPKIEPEELNPKMQVRA